MHGPADRIATLSHDRQVDLHNSRSHADSRKRMLDTRPSFVRESREGLGPRLSVCRSQRSLVIVCWVWDVTSVCGFIDTLCIVTVYAWSFVCALSAVCSIKA